MNKKRSKIDTLRGLDRLHINNKFSTQITSATNNNNYNANISSMNIPKPMISNDDQKENDNKKEEAVVTFIDSIYLELKNNKNIKQENIDNFIKYLNHNFADTDCIKFII